ncbi:MAG: 1-acyl-sn-glycerol-3-phosphate acyltransferase [Acidimicrobiia bacterium]
MIKPPPRIVRRLVVAPLVIVLCLVLIVLSPVILVVAAVVDLIRRDGARLFLLTLFGVAYLVLEVVGIMALFGLWILSGFGLWMRARWMDTAHYGFMRFWLRALSVAAKTLLRVRIVVVDDGPHQPGPVLVCCRHAGLGNSLMLVGKMLSSFRRRPRVVMLALLQWEPVFDILGNRLPNLFIDRDPAKSETNRAAAARLAAEMGDLDAFVIFPEGHDFTEKLRDQAIARLRSEGHHEHAERAEDLTNVLPPKHGGVLAAILAAPEADVVFVAHTVLEEVGTFADIVRTLPARRPVHARYWRVPAAEVPHDEELLIDWLFEWWKRIDTWIDDHDAPTNEPASAEGV